MRKITFLFFLIVPSVSWGQWNSFAWKKESYKVEIMADSCDGNAEYETLTTTNTTETLTNERTEGNSEETTITEETNDYPITTKKAQRNLYLDSLSKRLTRRYYSVCPPLNSIRITSTYGTRRDPFDHKKISMHAGIDLRAYYEPVYTMFPGKVIKIGSDERSGKYITVTSGDYAISYCHLSEVSVSEGERLKEGDCIAVSGNSGRSSGAHLHITCRRSGKVIDPTIVLQYICSVRIHTLEELERLALL